MMLLFLKSYWKQIAIVILITSAIGYVKLLHWQRDTARKELAEYVTIAKEQKRARDAEIALKERISNSDRSKLLNDHKSAIERIKSDYEKRLNTRDADIDKWRERVRLELANNGRLSEIPKPAEGTAESGADRDRAIAALEFACKVTTEDYNALYEAWESACNVYGCR